MNYVVFKVEVCSGSLVDVLQSVVSGSEGCLFSYGYAGLGRYTFSRRLYKKTNYSDCYFQRLTFFSVFSRFQVKPILWLAEMKRNKLWD